MKEHNPDATPDTRSDRQINKPSAFDKKIARGAARYHKLNSDYSFFFSKISGYDDNNKAWIYSEGKRKLNFCTYSYLGLLKHPAIEAAALSALKQYGTGTHGVRLLGGNLDIHERLEQRIAGFFGREAALTFSSGFMTNLTVIDSLLGKGDVIFCDELNHASIIDGCRIGHAQVVRFPHNDMQTLDQQLAAAPPQARKLIIIDAVYSMEGDLAPLDTLIALRDRHPNTLLMVDEAHSLGVLGANGKGIEEHFACRGQIDILMGTLSKTLPGQGGFIAATQAVIHYLRMTARGFIFSAALSPITTAAMLAAFDVLEQEGPQRRKKLMENITYFVAALRREGFEVRAEQAAIVPIMIYSESQAFAMAQYCHQRDIYVMPVGYPAVSKGLERLRMNVTYHHSKDDLDLALQVLCAAREAVAP
ncbi:aminotransferase class I/II-fold pyridoxal phosphate-dependent enzyme [Serratia rubidaea]|nr:aminotransferase class I/II-fold pyridoxal phosphate-dependent enzyme [Serratia rubidaea]